MWKTRGKKGLILLDFSTIHRVFHNPVENYRGLSTVFHRERKLAKLLKSVVDDVVTKGFWEDSLC